MIIDQEPLKDPVEPTTEEPDRLQFAIAVDQCFNALLGGWADETFSSRCYRCRNDSKKWWYAYKAVNHIFFWMADHCQSAYHSEVIRRNSPPALRT